MKIEIGESLFYSWLRHVKECQIVQNNWKVSTQWQLSNADSLSELMTTLDNHYEQTHGYRIFKQNTSLSQLLKQAECDVLGISVNPGEIKYYAVDVAFHESGLNYGDKHTTVMKVLEKCARTAFCLYGYLSTKDAEIIFASPKIHKSVLSDLIPCIEEMNTLFNKHGFNYEFRIISNNEYNDLVLKPILLVSDGVADTTELFLRSYKMFTMFTDKVNTVAEPKPLKSKVYDDGQFKTDDYQEFRVGRIANVILRRMLENGAASEDEIHFMQQPEYSKQFFGLNYPLLARADTDYDKLRYYSTPLYIKGTKYMLCSQWFEGINNNDRPYLINWINKHRQ